MVVSSTEPTVLFLDNSSTFGGAIVSLKHLVQGLAERGVQPIVVSGHPSHRLADAFPNARTISIDVQVPRRHPTALLGRMRQTPPRSDVLEQIGLRLGAVDWHLRRTLPSALQYLKIGKNKNVDLVHLNNILEGQLDGMLAAKLLGVPCVAHARGFQSSGVLLRSALHGIDRHIAISRAIGRNLEQIGASPEKISIVPDGIDIGQFSCPRDDGTLRRELGIPPDVPAFGLFGRIMRWKGTREFVLAAIRVLRTRPAARALVVGDVSDGDRSYFEEVRRVAEESGVADRILFTGYRDDIPALMHALDVVVHSSIEPEPFGMVIVEAMAAGTPVVAADRGGPVDIVEPGTTGLLVDPRDPEQLASGIEALIDAPERAQKMGRTGQKRARELFDRDRYAERVLSVYSEVLS